MQERLQKILARAGYGSRRACELLIENGQVTINGNQARLGSKADPGIDHIAVNGKTISKQEKLIYIALHKPKGVLSDEDSIGGRKTVRDLVPVMERLFSVGRLDFDSEGLILMTNDGELANRLTHPRYKHEKEYRVLLVNRPDEKQLAAWRRGVVLKDGFHTSPAKVEIQSTSGKNTWILVTLTEGRKRQIREVGNQIGLPVVRIVRIRIASLLLGKLKPGEWRYLTMKEINHLRTSANLPKQDIDKKSSD